jgi:malonyl-CoA O-methyltransferase
MARTMLDRHRAYAEWAASYPPSAHNALMRVEEAAVLRLLPPLAGLRVLDAGSGTGRYARLAMERGARDVVQFDASEAMLGRALRLGRSIRGELSQLPFRDSCFDVVVSGLALPDVPDIAPVIAEWRRVLRSGGTLVYSTLHPDGGRLGWSRTFETSAGSWSLPAHWHEAAAHHRACTAAGLTIESVVEPSIDQHIPVAFVVCARFTG